MTIYAKKPVQVYLRQDQIDALRLLAAKQGTSVAELIRQGIDRVLIEMPLEEDPIWKIVGSGNSSVHDLALEHDQYLAESEESNNRPPHA
ncbi:MAG: ribbon-helix-helix protein, CopG family [Caldilineaceae bacterium]|nr:ribbon-helix-helix protein, CopG family [Caldilineaceae bacterium]